MTGLWKFSREIRKAEKERGSNHLERLEKKEPTRIAYFDRVAKLTLGG